MTPMTKEKQLEAVTGKQGWTVWRGDRLEGTCITGLAEFLHAWVPLVPVIHSVETHVVSSSPLILATLHCGELQSGLQSS